MTRLEKLQHNLQAILGDTAALTLDRNELTLIIPDTAWVETCTRLRDHDDLAFEMLIDLCGIDYSAWRAPTYSVGTGPHPHRFAVVAHLMSIKHNWRLRVRTYATNEEFPVIDTLVNVWPCANWFEREAFDLYGIVFDGHPDLRRILTDYGFIGHPFRKDFPLSGHVEMRYDTEQQRVIYQPVTIEPREITPRVVREEGFGVGR
ncbi:MAG TPA: NADH-quinone oxidoreductase subunit C [Burkholderiaceae bacterium]|nr:NADH-quinone oxidoreductase subunit C [Burkholderiaceae bacterium]